METDNEEQHDDNRVRKLEEASETIDEAQTPIGSANADEALCHELLNSPSPEFSVSRSVIKSSCTEQMML